MKATTALGILFGAAMLLYRRSLYRQRLDRIRRDPTFELGSDETAEQAAWRWAERDEMPWLRRLTGHPEAGQPHGLENPPSAHWSDGVYRTRAAIGVATLVLFGIATVSSRLSWGLGPVGILLPIVGISLAMRGFRRRNQEPGRRD